MDYPKSVPNVGLVDGHFVDENPITGQVGSLIPAAWGDAITQEVLNVIRGAGMVPNEANVSQLLTAVLTIAASDFKKSVLVATTGPIALSGLQAIDGVAVPAGGRVLVKNQANAAQNWIYTAAAGAWVRAQDADESTECAPGHLVPVQSGAVNGGSVWQLSNTTPPVVGTTPLVFTLAMGKTGVAAGNYRQVTVDALGRVTAGSNPSTLEEAGITNALPNKRPLPGGSLALEGTSYAFLNSLSESSLNQNCFWDGANWMRMDTNLPALSLFASAGVLRVRRVQSAGPNPVIWDSIDTVLDTSNIWFDHIKGKPTTASAWGILDVFTKAQTATEIQKAVAALVGAAPGALDQLDELARAIGNDPNFSTTILNQLATKATKGSKLSDYGILDGLPIKNPLPLGSLDLHGDAYAFVTSLYESSINQNAYWNGSGWMRKDESMPAAGIYAFNGNIYTRRAPAGANPLVWSAPSAVLDTTQLATTDEAEAGSSNSKWMTPWLVAKAIAKKVVQATEAVAGILPVATIEKVNAGVDDASIVTPKKMRMGWVYNMAANGYLVAPPWLGGFVLQWGYVYESQSEVDYRAFTIPFPKACFGMVQTLEAATVGGLGTNMGLVSKVIDRTKFVWSVGGSAAGDGYGYFLAWGN